LTTLPWDANILHYIYFGELKFEVILNSVHVIF